MILPRKKLTAQQQVTTIGTHSLNIVHWLWA
jgi:hypothetical protein